MRGGCRESGRRIASGVRDTVSRGGGEHRQAVLDEQRAARIERMRALELGPERRALFRRAEVVRGHDAIDEPVDAGLLCLHRERVAMCVRHDPEMLAPCANRREKLRRARQIGHAMPMNVLELFDVEPEIAAPMIEAVPIERALDRIEAPRQPLARFGGGAAVELGVMRGHELEPKVIVEREIEQRAVHVDEHRVDSFPVDERRSRSSLHRTMIQEAP